MVFYCFHCPPVLAHFYNTNMNTWWHLHDFCLTNVWLLRITQYDNNETILHDFHHTDSWLWPDQTNQTLLSPDVSFDSVWSGVSPKTRTFSTNLTRPDLVWPKQDIYMTNLFYWAWPGSGILRYSHLSAFATILDFNPTRLDLSFDPRCRGERRKRERKSDINLVP